MNHPLPNFGILSHCVDCSAAYRPEDCRVVIKNERQQVFHLICPACRHALLFSFSRKAEGIICAGISTDFNFDDAKKSFRSKEVTIDDVISVHKALELDNFLKIM